MLCSGIGVGHGGVDRDDNASEAARVGEISARSKGSKVSKATRTHRLSEAARVGKISARRCSRSSAVPPFSHRES